MSTTSEDAEGDPTYYYYIWDTIKYQKNTSFLVLSSAFTKEHALSCTYFHNWTMNYDT